MSEEEIKGAKKYLTKLEFDSVIDEPIEQWSIFRVKETGELNMCFATYKIDDETIYIDIDKKHHRGYNIERVRTRDADEYSD